MRRYSLPDILHAVAALAGVAAVTFIYRRWLVPANATTVALTYLLLVLFVAAWSRQHIIVFRGHPVDAK